MKIAIVGGGFKQMGPLLVVRVNRAPHSLTEEKHKFIGSRTDVLFYSFYENNYSCGGGPIDPKLYAKRGIKFIIIPNLNR